MINTKNNEEKRGRMQIGSSSLLLVFTVLCLVVFSVLALSSSKADWKLAQKNMSNLQQYYKADGIAEEMVKGVNELLIKSVSSDPSVRNQQEVFQAVLKNKLGTAYNEKSSIVTYQIDINEEQFILISLYIKSCNEIRDGIKNYEVMSWAVQNKIDFEMDDSIPVWDGEV